MSPYRALSLWALLRAAWRGPAALLRNRVRALSIRTLMRLLRRMGL